MYQAHRSYSDLNGYIDQSFVTLLRVMLHFKIGRLECRIITIGYLSHIIE